MGRYCGDGKTGIRPGARNTLDDESPVTMLQVDVLLLVSQRPQPVKYISVVAWISEYLQCEVEILFLHIACISASSCDRDWITDDSQKPHSMC